jgi:inosine/xanthosine triphosphatase
VFPELIVVIGSTNKAKIRGVIRAFKLLGVRDYETIPVHGYSDQPIGLNDILLNAAKRVVEAYKHLNSREGYAVGIEAGVVEIGNIMLSGQLAIVTDGERYSIGVSGFFPLPNSIREKIVEGVELGVLMEEMSRIESVRESIGAVGFFTKGFSTREELSYYATLYAIIPWMNPDVDYDLPPYNMLEEMLKRAGKN